MSQGVRLVTSDGVVVREAKRANVVLSEAKKLLQPLLELHQLDCFEVLESSE